ncbi:MAG: site-specific integrase [Planctomycetes bacterium]|nr:site-specific integrase [Planctomycetota bacterium]
MPYGRKGARMLRVDSQKAGIDFIDAAGRVFDFHGLRHSFITMVDRAGAHPRTTQRLARHSRSEMTDRYTHVALASTARAAAALPDLSPSASGALQATGTEGVPWKSLPRTRPIGAD